MSAEDLKQILAECRELSEKATLGPWKVDYRVETVWAGRRQNTADFCLVAEYYLPDDAAFIARARTLLPQLVSAVEELQREAEDAALETLDAAVRMEGDL